LIERVREEKSYYLLLTLATLMKPPPLVVATHFFLLRITSSHLKSNSKVLNLFYSFTFSIFHQNYIYVIVKSRTFY